MLWLVAIAGCDESPSVARPERGTIVAETKAPRTAVRSWEGKSRPNCSSEAGTFSFFCEARAQMHGCSWLEVGLEVESDGPLRIPLSNRGEFFPCGEFAENHRRVELSSSSSWKPAEVS